jgi:hypothetical protein
MKQGKSEDGKIGQYFKAEIEYNITVEVNKGGRINVNRE